MASSATPSFLDPILADAFDREPSLLVMASGLGLHIVLQRLVEANSGPEHLVLLLNTTKEDEQQLLEQCAARGVVAPAIINNECPAQERMELYLAGGVLAVTQRILVVDLLCERVPAALATGIVVANAHRVTEGGNLAFILRIFRQLNRTAFIKALSDDPPALTKGFAQVEKVMRWLRVRKLQLWPRFHVSVSACLDAMQPVVEECSVSLSGKAKELQQALLRAVDECLTELKGGSSAVDVAHLTVENALFKSFDVIVRRQLDPVWHQISRRTKSLVADLRTLRQLLNFLVRHDCVSFFEYLETVFDAASLLHPSERPHWLLNCSEDAFVLARDRVYALQRTQPCLFQALPTPALPGSGTSKAACAAARRLGP
jgi:DNA excision repair protein ERCC-4